MDEKKSSRWPELITIACTGWLLYSSIQQYQRMATVDIFTPAELTEFMQERHILWVIYTIALVKSCFRFLLHGFDAQKPGMRLFEAVQSTLETGVWACLWAVGFSETQYVVLWAAVLVFMTGWTLWDWWKFRKACREREMA